MTFQNLQYFNLKIKNSASTTEQVRKETQAPAPASNACRRRGLTKTQVLRAISFASLAVAAVSNLRRKIAATYATLSVQLTAWLCSGLLLCGCLPSPARAQSAAACQKTAAFVNPQFSDNATGWSPMTNAQNIFVVGDIDGDGNDELAAVLPDASGGSIQFSRWIQTGWSPMNVIPHSTIFAPANFSLVVNGSISSAGLARIQLVDVDGDGQQELVVDIEYNGPLNTFIQGYVEQIYHYNKLTFSWSLLSAYKTLYFHPSYWFKEKTTDKQFARFQIDPYNGGNPVDMQILLGNWSPEKGTGKMLGVEVGGLGSCVHNDCVAFADVNGDGITDLIYVDGFANVSVNLSSTSAFFDGQTITSSVKIPVDKNGKLDPAVTASWQVGDINGGGQGELTYLISNGSLFAYYWDKSKNDFTAVRNSPYFFGSNVVSSTLAILPKPLLDSYYGITLMIPDGTYVVGFTKDAQGNPDPQTVAAITDVIDGNKGFNPAGYSGFYRVAVENQEPVLLARSPSGIVSAVSNQNANHSLLHSYVDPETLTDRGYPAYTASQQNAYQYISGVATRGNPDIRSLYTDPAVPWSFIQFQIETMPAPPASSGISATDFQFVQNQTIEEVSALESVNLLYGVTGQILTNTYLVKDATLAEVTAALGLPSQPDVAQTVLNEVTTAVGGLGALLEGVSSIVTIATVAADASRIANVIGSSGALLELLGAVTGDTAAYAGPVPASGTNNFDLKTTLDNQSLGAATSNSCHQLASLSSWTSSKFIFDSVLTGTLPLDLETQQDVLAASQATFRMTVWQALLQSTPWSYVSVLKEPPAFCQNCLFPGNASYPLADSVQVTGSCSGLNEPQLLSLLIEDSNNHNYPNLSALNALFSGPPNGLGVKPAALFFNQNGWVLPYVGDDLTFWVNDGGYKPLSCTTSTFKVASPQVKPNVRVGAPLESLVFSPGMARPVEADAESANVRLEHLIADVRTNLTDANLRDRLLVMLDVANVRLKQAQRYGNEPKETLRLLNQIIAQSQWHATQSVRDSETSQNESIEAIAIRDSLISYWEGATEK